MSTQTIPVVVTTVNVTSQSKILKVDSADRVDPHATVEHWLRVVVAKDKQTTVDLTFYTGDDRLGIVTAAIKQAIEELRSIGASYPLGGAQEDN